MSLIECPECKQEISSKAIFCPKCGFPLIENVNKKIKKKTAEKSAEFYNGIKNIDLKTKIKHIFSFQWLDVLYDRIVEIKNPIIRVFLSVLFWIPIIALFLCLLIAFAYIMGWLLETNSFIGLFVLWVLCAIISFLCSFKWGMSKLLFYYFLIATIVAIIVLTKYFQ